MKKHILLGLIAAACCMDSAKAEGYDIYGKLAVGVQYTKDTCKLDIRIPGLEIDYKGDDTHTRFCGYVGMGTDISFAEKGFVKIELGTSLATNAKKEGDLFGMHAQYKSNGYIPRGFVALGYDFGEARVYGGVGAAYQSNKFRLGDQELKNSGFTPMIVAGVGKRINDKVEASLEGSYFFKKDKKERMLNVADVKAERKGFEVTVGVSYHAAM